MLTRLVPARDRMTGTPDPDDRNVTRLLRCLVEQAREHAFLLFTPSGEIMWCNSGAEQLFSISREDFVGRQGSEIFTDRDRAAGLDGLELAIARAEAVAQDDRWHVRADGSSFWSSGAMLPLKDVQTGELLGFGKIIRDRTDLKAQIELMTNQLRQAQQRDEDKDHAITKLTHELRNAISGLRGAVELLDRPLDDEQRRARFNRLMHKQLAIVEQLTQDMLDVKRAGAGKIALKVERLSVQQELRDLLARFESRLVERKLTAQLLAPPADIVVEGDRTRLQQVFGNLIDNAIKYTPAEGRIWVKATVDDTSALVYFEDTGRGIPPSKLTSIFELFTQVDAQTPMGGLGVGLALVRELVLLHGGSVQAASKGEGQGSQFTVRLPLAALAMQGNG